MSKKETIVCMFDRVNQPGNFREMNLDEALFDIKHSKELRDRIESLRGAEESLYAKYKLTLPAISPSCTFNSKRGNNDIKEYNGVIHLDYDHLNEEEVVFVKTELSKMAFVYAIFTSPSGKGVKVFIKTTASKENHIEYFNLLRNICDSVVGIDSDMTVKDISRLCFLSSDKDLYQNHKADIFEIKDYLTASEFVEEPNLDWVFNFTSNKQSFVKNNRNNFTFVFACNANKYGIDHEDAIAYMSNYSELDFNVEEINRTITGAYRRYAYEHASLQYCSTSTFKSADGVQSELIPDDIFEELPDILKRACSKFEGRERDVFLMSSITVLSGFFSNIKGKYDGKEVFPNLYTFIVANAASGKSAAKYAKAICKPHHHKLVEKTKREMTSYQIRKNQYDGLKKKNKAEGMEEPIKPKQKVFYFPGNSSEASLIGLIADNEGKGCVFETEADTLSGSNGKEWGDFSHVLRNNFHHEDISRSRKTDNEYTEINSSRFSLLLTGTPEQVRRLIPNAEDGLYSRFIFYSYAIQYVWRSTFTETLEKTVDSFIEEIGVEFDRLHSNQIERSFNITKNQGDILDEYFSNKLKQLVEEGDVNAISVLYRHGLMVYKIAMTLSAVMSNDKDLICANNIFDVSFRLITEVLFTNSFNLLDKMSDNKSSLQKVDLAFNFLDYNFERKDILDVCKKIGLKERSAANMLNKMLSQGMIKKLSHGKYQKTNNR